MSEENELYTEKFLKLGSIDVLLEWIRYLKSKGYNSLITILGETFFDLFSYNIEFLDELGIAYYYTQQYDKSWNTYMRILQSKALTEDQHNQYFFNAHFNIPFIQNNYIGYPERLATPTKIPPLITFSITTCKRYDLFEQTINSFLNCCTDVNLISKWICVDDNSSQEDREKMEKNYPFFKFYWKNKNEKGHAQSMNIILDLVDTPYLFHMEDDWKYFKPHHYIQDCLEVLNSNDKLGQCLINRNYAEESTDTILGGIFHTTTNGTRYYIHDYQPDIEQFINKYGAGPNCAYWPHYSLRPGLNKMSVLKEIGTYNPCAAHFEMDFSHRYIQHGYQTAFLDEISCLHTGRLTKDIGDKTKLNAYILNNELQFVDKDSENTIEISSYENIYTDRILHISNIPTQPYTNFKSFVINMETRPDRMETFQKEIERCREQDGNFMDITRVLAVDGYKLKPTRQLEQIFNPNDYNYRRGMIGCALSHIGLWTMAVYSSDLYIILEDDITFVDYFIPKINATLQKLQGTEWDILFLGHHLYPQYKTEDSYHKFKVPTPYKWSTERSLRESIGGTGGYIITPKGAVKMLDFIHRNGMTNGIDTVMQKACDNMNTYYCDTHLIYSECYTNENTNTIDTDIQKNYDSMKRDFFERIQRELDFYGELEPCSLLGTDDKDNVYICLNGCCKDKVKDYTFYNVEHARVYVPDQYLRKNPESREIGFITQDNRLSVENIILY